MVYRRSAPGRGRETFRRGPKVEGSWVDKVANGPPIVVAQVASKQVSAGLVYGFGRHATPLVPSAAWT